MPRRLNARQKAAIDSIRANRAGRKKLQDALRKARAMLDQENKKGPGACRLKPDQEEFLFYSQGRSEENIENALRSLNGAYSIRLLCRLLTMHPASEESLEAVLESKELTRSQREYLLFHQKKLKNVLMGVRIACAELLGPAFGFGDEFADNFIYEDEYDWWANTQPSSANSGLAQILSRMPFVCQELEKNGGRVLFLGAGTGEDAQMFVEMLLPQESGMIRVDVLEIVPKYVLIAQMCGLGIFGDRPTSLTTEWGESVTGQIDIIVQSFGTIDAGSKVHIANQIDRALRPGGHYVEFSGSGNEIPSYLVGSPGTGRYGPYFFFLNEGSAGSPNYKKAEIEQINQPGRAIHLSSPEPIPPEAFNLIGREFEKTRMLDATDYGRLFILKKEG